ncbi:dTMP kinase [Lichenicoccus sp.]|uniref:dTMP kinase n=1 Tax=Lichenicoccus sp. TaxID=2781899 RepID=UPI003D0CC265
MSGLLVTIEGGEGAGKTTQSALLAAALEQLGCSVLRTREPGGAPGAEALRGFLLGRDHGLSLRAEAMAHFAARIDHVDSTIKPALASGRLVLCDRFTDSTLAYQGYGLARGDPAVLDFIARLTALLDVRPALTLMLDVRRAEGRRRVRLRGQDDDRYERLDEAFHERVAAGYRTIAAADPARCRLIAAGDPVEAVQRRMVAAVQALLRDGPLQEGAAAPGRQ